MPPSRNASGKVCRSRRHCRSAEIGRRPPLCHVLVSCGWASAVSQDLDSYLGTRELPFEIRSRRSDRSNMLIAIILMVAVTLVAAKAVGDFVDGSHAVNAAT